MYMCPYSTQVGSPSVSLWYVLWTALRSGHWPDERRYISNHLIQVTLFFENFSWARSAKCARAKRARCERVGPIDCIKVSLKKNHSHLSYYCSLDIVYAVKDCDPCDRALLTSQWLLQSVSVSVSVCLCVCPAFTAYISITMGRILIKLGRNVKG